MRPRILVALAAVIVFAGASCGGSASFGGSDETGVLLIARPDGIIEYEIESGAETMLLPQPEPNAFVLDPAVSADNARIAYVVQPPPKIEGGVYDAGSDLWVAARDGSDPRTVFEHIQPNQLVRFPAWLDDNRILAIVQETQQRDGRTMVIYALQEIDVTTGDRRTVREDVISFAISPEGDRVVYAELAPQFGEALRAAPLEGGEPETLVSIEDNLSPFSWPRFSPDGSRIAFASADQTAVVRAGGHRYVSANAAPPPHPAADGLPQDIWIIDAQGGPVRQAADLKEDLPALTWSGDGERIYVVGANGMYDVNLTSGEVLRIGAGVFHAQVTWAPPR